MLPDFFVDHFVGIPTLEPTVKSIQTIVAQGGGNLPGYHQRITQGGNAANTALALSRLGISTHLICRTDTFGKHLLEYFLGMHHVDLSAVKTDGRLAMTTALEFRDAQANVMLGDPGSVADFSFASLSDSDQELIATADLVGITNWNLNASGTSLACEVLRLAKRHNVTTFFDSSDPSPKLTEIHDLRKRVLSNPQLDIFGLNENELHYYTKTQATTQEEMIAAAAALKKNVPARIDLHTAQFSCSIRQTSTVVPTMPLNNVHRFTGAGDAWNAANLCADLLGLPDDERLYFANLFAGLFISSPEPIHPTMDTLMNTIKKTI